MVPVLVFWVLQIPFSPFLSPLRSPYHLISLGFCLRGHGCPDALAFAAAPLSGS